MNQWKKRLKMYIVGLIILLCNMSGASPSTPTKSSSFTSSKSATSSKAASSASSYSGTKASPTKSSSFTPRREAQETPKSIAPTKSSSFSSTKSSNNPASYQTTRSQSTPTGAVTASTVKANSSGKSYTSKAEAEAAYQQEQEARSSKYTSKPIQTKTETRQRQTNGGYSTGYKDDDTDEEDYSFDRASNNSRQRSSYDSDDDMSSVVGALAALALIANQIDDDHKAKPTIAKDTSARLAEMRDTTNAVKSMASATSKEPTRQSHESDFLYWVMLIFFLGVVGFVAYAIIKTLE